MPIEILILEDNVADAELVKRELRKTGLDLRTRWVQDKAGFVAALEAAAPDLILADYSLPGFDGLTALQLARQRWEDVPVIIVSGAIGEELAIDALKAGATDYVLKQRLSRLDPVVRRALQEAAEVARRKQAQVAMQQAHEQLQEQAEELRAQAAELQAANDTLRESEQRYRAIGETIPYGVWLTDAAGACTYVSDSFLRLVGMTLEQVQQLGWLHLLPPEEVEPTKEHWLRCVTTGEPFEREHRVRTAAGDYRHILAIGRPIRNERGQITSWAGINLDITERKRAEAELHRLNEELERRVEQRTVELRHRTRQLQKLALEMSAAEDRERERLAHILHDDLQQELAAAKFHLSIVRNRTGYDASMQGVIAKVDGMLKNAIGKSRGLSHELSPAVLRQGNFAENLQWLASQIQAKHGLVVHVHGQADSPSDAIRAFLYRTAQEFLFNAVKHAQVNEARVRVRQCRGCICLSVSDRGRGFDPAQLRETAGFGLLSIRERIELLGGRMKIRSAPGRGSTFFVIVPGGETAGQPIGRAAEVSPAGEEEGRLRVLLADDHEVVRQGLIALLGGEETIEVVGEAANGREAVDLTERLHPDVVLMDVSMPVMSGEEATRQIKQELPRTRIVSLTMREEPEVRERMRQAGAESYVLKTAPYGELLAAIRGEQIIASPTLTKQLPAPRRRFIGSMADKDKILAGLDLRPKDPREAEHE